MIEKKMEEKRPIRRTVMVFLVHEGEVLLLFHKKGKSWMGPGGHIEDDELAIEAVQRELFEETGIVYRPFNQPVSPISNRCRAVLTPVEVMTYQGYEGFDDGNLYEDQIFYIQVPKAVREQPLNAKEGHRVEWVSIREAIANYEMYDEVRMLLLRQYLNHNRSTSPELLLGEEAFQKVFGDC